MNKKDELIKAQKEYISFLGEELRRHESMIVARPYMAPSDEVIKKGAQLRDKIESLSNG